MSPHAMKASPKQIPNVWRVSGPMWISGCTDRSGYLLLDARRAVRHPAGVVARCALPVLIALLPAVVPATASAGISSRAPGSDVLTVSENGAETNSVTITLSGGVYTMKDEAGMGAGANCDDTTPGDPTTVTCPAGPVASIS